MKFTRKNGILVVFLFAVSLAFFKLGPARHLMDYNTKLKTAVFSAAPDDQVLKTRPYQESGSKVGRILTYSIEFTNKGYFDPSVIIGAESGARNGLKYKVDSSLRGKIHEVTLPEDGFLKILAVDFQGMDFFISINGERNGELMNEMKNAMENGIILETDLAGIIKSMRFSERSSTFAKNYLKSVFGAMQFAKPKGDFMDNWESEEYDVIGLFVASYRMESGDDGTIIKRKRRYLKTHSSLEGMDVASKMTVALDGSYRFRFKEGREYFSLLDGEEESSYENAKNGNVLGKSSIKISASLDFSGKLSDDQMVLTEKRIKNVLFAAAPLSMSVSIRDKGDGRAFQKSLLGDLKYSDLKRMMAEFDAASKEEQAGNRTELFLKLRAFVHTDESELSSLKTDLKAMSAQSESFNLWINAISGAGTPKAQKLLSDLIMEMALNAAALEILIPSLGMVEHPAYESEKLLRRLAGESDNQDVMVMSNLALGIMCNKLIRGEANHGGTDIESRIQALIGDTTRALSDARDKTQKSLYLSVLGNIADERVLPVIEGYLHDEVEDVRKSAVMALRLIDTPNSLELTIRAIAREKSDHVKLSAINSLFYRKNHRPGVDQFKYIYDSQKSQIVKRGLLDEIARLGSPQSRKLLLDISSSEKEDSLRSYAKKLIRG
ncbi:MAG: HEAT repeat domain-containing protein [Oligoflexales bacterium]|nr:HEAT repeat domain-containing protein [Oligoflexales bacterium]